MSAAARLLSAAVLRMHSTPLVAAMHPSSHPSPTTGSPSDCPADGNSPAQSCTPCTASHSPAHHAQPHKPSHSPAPPLRPSPSAVSAAPFCTSRGPSCHQAGPNRELPWLKWAFVLFITLPASLYRAQPCTGSASPPTHLRLQISVPSNSGSTPNFCGLLSFWENRSVIV